MSPMSADARAVVAAVDRLTTQVKRLADAQATPVAIIRDGVTTPLDAPTTTADDGVKRSRPFPYPREVAEDEAPMRAYLRGADEEQQRTARRERLHNLLARADRITLTPGEVAALRDLVDTEIRNADQLRAGRATWKAKAEEIERDRDEQYDRAERAVRRAADEYDRRQDAERERDAEQARLRDLLRSESQRGNKAIDREATAEQAAEEARAELEQAQAALERVRAVVADIARSGWTGSATARWISEALDGTEQPATEADSDEAQHAKLDEATAALRRVRAVTKDWEQQALPRSEAHRLLVDVRNALAGPRPDPEPDAR